MSKPTENCCCCMKKVEEYSSSAELPSVIVTFFKEIKVVSSKFICGHDVFYLCKACIENTENLIKEDVSNGTIPDASNPRPMCDECKDGAFYCGSSSCSAVICDDCLPSLRTCKECDMALCDDCNDETPMKGEDTYLCKMCFESQLSESAESGEHSDDDYECECDSACEGHLMYGEYESEDESEEDDSQSSKKRKRDECEETTYQLSNKKPKLVS